MPRRPRTLDDRRIQAHTALLTGITTLACHCGTDNCPATNRPQPIRNTTIYLITDTTGANTDTAGEAQADQPTDPTGGEQSAAQGQAPVGTRELRPGTTERSTYVFGAGLTPTALLAGMCTQATVREIIHPGQAGPEPRYTPSAALAAYIRCRDLTCRFPGCDTPATDTDIDHTVPYPTGPTHPSNLKSLCRFHYRLAGVPLHLWAKPPPRSTSESRPIQRASNLA
ncbi:HNH endonuclease signature motif containing protein [Mycobacterium sp. ZZG]